MVKNINGFGDSDNFSGQNKKNFFDPSSEEAARSLSDKIQQEMSKGHYTHFNNDKLLIATNTAQNDFITYDKNLDGILSPKEIKDSKSIFDYMNTKNGTKGKKIYVGTDYPSYVLNWYNKHTVKEER